MAKACSVGPLLSAHQVAHFAGAQLDEHRHADGQLIVVLRGTAAISSSDGWWLAPPGLAAWLPPNFLHGARYSESSLIINLLIARHAAVDLPTHCGLIAVSGLVRELALEGARHGATSDSSSLVGQLLVEEIGKRSMSPRLFVPDGRDPRLRRAIGLLRAAPGRAVTLDQLASAANTSARTLARLFVAETTMSFGRWREHLRIVNAVDRLARGRSITATALELGYHSASSFTALFTRSLGVPPRRYMEQLNASQI